MPNKSKIYQLFSLIIWGSLLGSGSVSGKNNLAQAQQQLKVVASHNILCDLVETIAEETVDLTCLIDTEQNIHTYRPTPSQRKAIAEAQLVLYGGYELEPQIIKLIAATQTNASKIAVYEQVVGQPILSQHEHSEAEHSEAEHSEAEHSEAEHSEAEHSEAEHSEADPHIWHDVENTIAAVELIQSQLIQANPQQADIYLANTANLIQKLWELNTWIDEQIATIPPEKRILVTTHDSFNYYAKAYNFTDYRALQGLSAATSPTASQVRRLATEIEQLGVPTIFVEFSASDRVMNNLARAAKVKLSPEELYADGLGEAPNYIEMMSHNTCAIVNGLAGECEAFGN